MKKQINPTIKAHLIRGAFYLLLVLGVCAIPFALAQRNPAARKMSPTVSNPTSTHIPALAPASAFRVPAPKLPNAKGIAQNRALASIFSNIPLLTYMIDDGTAEDSVGLTAGGNLLCLNSFPVTGGNNVISSISIAWGTPAFPDPTLNGLPYTAYLWSDPNGDGSPTDGVVLAMAPGVVAQQGTDTFITTVIPPTMVTTPNFFVGFLITHTAGQFPAAFDQTAPNLPMRSWVSIGGNPNNLSDAQPIEVATGGALVGNWLIRAEGNPGGPTPTGTPSPTPTATCQPTYTTATTTGTVSPGGTDIGNHCDDCTTMVTLPFPVNAYGSPTSVVHAGSNGTLQFVAVPQPKPFFFDQCIPVDPTKGGPFLDTLFPYYDDLRTDETGVCADCGIFTQTLGTAPNRQFVIRWKTTYFNHPGKGTAEFEVLLTEGSDTLSAIYGPTLDSGLEGASGIQHDLNVFTSFSCNEATLTPGLRVNYIPTTCGSPTPTATPTATATATATTTATATPSGSPSPPRQTPSPRPRPTPAPRP